MKNHNVADRRQHKRLRIPSGASTFSTSGALGCRLIDISRIGAGAQVAVPIPEMTLVQVEIHLEAGAAEALSIQCQAAVVRSIDLDDGTYEIGLFFMDLEERDRRAIDRYIELNTPFESAPAVRP
jgi:c-di-GMP-binding flagellar brake protein YcgR